MQPPKHLLVLVDVALGEFDLTPGSERAVEQALWIASRFGARASFFHSTTHERYYDPIGGGTLLVGEGPREEALERLQGLVREANGHGIKAELVLDAREPWEAVQDVAEELGCDLVVAGKRSRAESKGHRLGRTSRRVLHATPVPAWITAPEHAGPVRTILAATDFSEVGSNAVAGAAVFAKAFGAALHVVHAVPMEFLPSAQYGAETFVRSADVEQSIRMQDAQSRLEALRASLPVEASVQVLDKPPYDALRDHAEELKADLVALGTAARRGLAGVLIGNTAEWLVGNLAASLLAFPPPPEAL